MTERAESEPLVVADVTAWRAWLDQHEASSDGLWVLLAKKGTVDPTSLTYQDALEEALCGGWIDGQRKSVDAHTFKQRYTPRRQKSLWSLRNIEIVTRLTAEGRMRERGFAEIERAQADGRWDRAYAGPATAEVPDELARALKAHPAANAAFEKLNRTERYSALHPILTATTAATLERRIERLIASLLQR
ncbi:YdeI/OmpD-associated family protein [Leucobacter salsicius]|uniref:YdeI/OmpD-associated family protein n=1 Tax=Leucobacter salsicius TaxID=664638 RepID=UPI000372F03C|nr:YdeI/OmpD-associated family protein [Leucobacter salsicius]